MTNGDYKPLFSNKRVTTTTTNPETGEKTEEVYIEKDVNEVKLIRLLKWGIVTYLSILAPSVVQYILPILNAIPV